MSGDRNAVLEEAAVAAEAQVDKDWPNDDVSSQCKRIASSIRDLKKHPDVSVSIGVTHPGDKHFADPRGADDKINYVVLVACKDNTSHKDNGEVVTWAELVKAIEKQLMTWIDQDGLNVRNITISATRDAVYQRRTGPV